MSEPTKYIHDTDLRDAIATLKRDKDGRRIPKIERIEAIEMLEQGIRQLEGRKGLNITSKHRKSFQNRKAYLEEQMVEFHRNHGRRHPLYASEISALKAVLSRPTKGE